jgi:sensor histidine kinase regulating citrate/malate metabolism
MYAGGQPMQLATSYMGNLIDNAIDAAAAKIC